MAEYRVLLKLSENLAKPDPYLNTLFEKYAARALGQLVPIPPLCVMVLIAHLGVVSSQSQSGALRRAAQHRPALDSAGCYSNIVPFYDYCGCPNIEVDLGPNEPPDSFAAMNMLTVTPVEYGDIESTGDTVELYSRSFGVMRELKLDLDVLYRAALLHRRAHGRLHRAAVRGRRDFLYHCRPQLIACRAAARKGGGRTPSLRRDDGGGPCALRRLVLLVASRPSGPSVVVVKKVLRGRMVAVFARLLLPSPFPLPPSSFIVTGTNAPAPRPGRSRRCPAASDGRRLEALELAAPRARLLSPGGTKLLGTYLYEVGAVTEVGK
ncbi:hypothetical protein FB451DRAFT_1562384 [Mycena latifolia]|nr:hypothetical protein FB451DRAFT_1562384 [Mycena latifolia]